MENQRLTAAIEAILFTMGDSVEITQLAAALEVEAEKIQDLLKEMKQRYEEEDRGIRILELENACQLCTKTEYYDYLIRIAKQPKKYALTEVLLETLSIVAYKQPVTRLEIEKIRGVKCDHAVNKLVEYGLIEEVGRLDAPGRPALFATTEEFLRRFGIGSTDSLPAMDPVQAEEIRSRGFFHGGSAQDVAGADRGLQRGSRGGNSAEDS